MKLRSENVWKLQTAIINRPMSKDGSTVRYASIFPEKYGTLVRYIFFVMVRVRYVDTLFELKTPDFSHIAPVF